MSAPGYASMRAALQQMEERYRIFQDAQVTDIAEYNEQASREHRLERRVLVMDEFQDLVSDKTSAQAFFGGIRRLGAGLRDPRRLQAVHP